MTQNRWSPYTLCNVGATSFHNAVYNGHLKTAEQLLSSGADVNSAYTNGYTPLHVAVKHGDEEITKLLLNKGARVYCKSDIGETPLHIAAESGHLQIVEHLLNYGAHVNSEYTSSSRKGYTPLHLAVERGYEEITKLILKKGAHVYGTYYKGITPLHIAAENGHLQIVRLLLNHGAHVDSACTSSFKKGDTSFEKGYAPLHLTAIKDDTETPLHLAVSRGHLQIVEELLNYGADINSTYTDFTRKNNTPLHIAVEEGHEEITKMLLNRGAHAYPRRDDGETPLHIAVKCRHLQIVEYLLTHGADINSLYKNSYADCFTPLQLAVQDGDTNITELLLSRGADVHTELTNGETFLLIAVRFGHLHIVELLLNYRADVNSAYTSSVKMGYTPLHIAVSARDEEMTKLLLSRGADACGASDRDTTPLHIAVEHECFRLVEHLLNHGADVNPVKSHGRKVFTPLYIAISKGNEKITKLLLNRGVRVNGNDCGTTPLHLAVRYGYLEIVEQLLDHGADVNSTVGGSYYTPLYLAVYYACEEITILLLNRGAHTCVKSNKGETLLHVAVESGEFEIVEHLLNFRADVNAVYTSSVRKDYTPLTIAAMDRHDDIVKLLLVYGASVSSEQGNLEHDEMTDESGQTIFEMLLEYKREVERIKKEKIINSNISFWNILTVSMNQLAMYTMNENIVQVFNSEVYKTKFPIYASMLNIRFQKGIERKELFEKSCKHFCSLFKSFPGLPQNCIEKILNYLSIKHLNLFADGGK